MSWKDLYEHKLIAPYIPNVLQIILQPNKDNFDAKYANDIKKDLDDAAFQNSILLKEPEIQAQFADYYYDYENKANTNKYSAVIDAKDPKKDNLNITSTADVYISSIQGS